MPRCETSSPSETSEAAPKTQGSGRRRPRAKPPTPLAELPRLYAFPPLSSAAKLVQGVFSYMPPTGEKTFKKKQGSPPARAGDADVRLESRVAWQGSRARRRSLPPPSSSSLSLLPLPPSLSLSPPPPSPARSRNELEIVCIALVLHTLSSHTGTMPAFAFRCCDRTVGRRSSDSDVSPAEEPWLGQFEGSTRSAGPG